LKTNYNDIDELLVKYLTGEASAAEKTQVQDWLQQREQNRQYYDHFRLIWEESLQLAATTKVDENAAWRRFKQRTQEASQAKVRALPTARWVRIAAAVILVAGISWIAWFLAGGNSAEIPLAILETTNEVKSDTLPDGSFITINKNSSLSWPQQFKGKSRNVQLTGEGFFSVTPDKQKPFIVNAGNNITIEVLGTSFNVKSREDSTEVIVETGNVEVSWLTSKVMLHAGEKVIIKNGADSVQKQAVNDRLYNYYRSRTFVCDNTPLWKLVQALNEAYEANIIIENQSLRDLRLNVTFKDESLDNVLEIVAKTFEIDVIKQDSTIFLR
jgi:transmembrane sensor